MRKAATKAMIPFAISAVAALAVAVPSSLGSSPDGSGPPLLKVRHGATTVKPSLGSHCWPHAPRSDGLPESQLCSDAAYPLAIRNRLVVREGWQLELDTVAAATSVSTGLVRVDGPRIRHLQNVKARRQPGSTRRWTVTLPPTVRNASILNVSVRYTSGDANFWVGLRYRPRVR